MDLVEFYIPAWLVVAVVSVLVLGVGEAVARRKG
jgi:hypothetical protein